VLLSALAFGGIGAAVTLLLPPSYEVETALLVSPSTGGSAPSYEDLLAGQLLAQTYAELALTRPILASVASGLGLDDTPEQLADEITAQVSGVNPIVRIAVRGADPARAAGIANEVARQLIARGSSDGSDSSEAAEDLRQSLATVDSEIERAQAEIDALTGGTGSVATSSMRAAVDRLSALLATRGSLLQLIAETRGNTLSVIEPADTPSAPAAPALLRNVAAAALLGALLMAGALALAAEAEG